LSPVLRPFSSALELIAEQSFCMTTDADKPEQDPAEERRWKLSRRKMLGGIAAAGAAGAAAPFIAGSRTSRPAARRKLLQLTNFTIN
jgi:hypothetical protein